MITEELGFVTPRPFWATSTDTGSIGTCTHIREYIAGPVSVSIMQVDTLTEYGTVETGTPEILLDGCTDLTPVHLMRLSKACLAAAEQYARIMRA